MGLFDMFKKKAEPAAAAAPASISASAGADVLCSPVKGKVIKMADVPDPVFGGEVLGKGCAVWPEDDLVYAPCDGKVTVTMGHAVGLQSDSGIEVLVHVGVDTVNMNGDGFEGFVKADDVVKAGQPILKIDRAKIAAAGYKDCVVVAVSNTAEFADVELAVEADSAVAAGDAIVKVVSKKTAASKGCARVVGFSGHLFYCIAGKRFIARWAGLQTVRTLKRTDRAFALPRVFISG